MAALSLWESTSGCTIVAGGGLCMGAGKTDMALSGILEHSPAAPCVLLSWWRPTAPYECSKSRGGLSLYV
ncbi:g11181 [Coccomyxa elongata]